MMAMMPRHHPLLIDTSVPASHGMALVFPMIATYHRARQLILAGTVHTFLTILGYQMI